MVRFSLSVTILQMTENHSKSNISHNGTCSHNSSFGTLSTSGGTSGFNSNRRYNWTEKEVNQIEAGFFYGILGAKFIFQHSDIVKILLA